MFGIADPLVSEDFVVQDEVTPIWDSFVAEWKAEKKPLPKVVIKHTGSNNKKGNK